MALHMTKKESSLPSQRIFLARGQRRWGIIKLPNFFVGGGGGWNTDPKIYEGLFRNHRFHQPEIPPRNLITIEINQMLVNIPYLECLGVYMYILMFLIQLLAFVFCISGSCNFTGSYRTTGCDLAFGMKIWDFWGFDQGTSGCTPMHPWYLAGVL